MKGRDVVETIESGQLQHQWAGTGPLHRFRDELGDRWPQVRPLCLDLDGPDLAERIADHRRHARRASSGVDVAADVTGDLEALLFGWDHYGPAERAVLRGAVRYVTDVAPSSPTHGGDPDEVVGAAVRALLRR